MAVYPKHYLDVDVLTAARERFDQILERFDDAYVGFSGGKDSLVCLHLFKEAWERAGRTGPVKVLFYDEELIPDNVISFVDGYRRKPWVKMFWYAFPMESNKFVLGRVDRYVQWDPDRPHVRPLPPWAIVPAPGRKGTFSQYVMESEMVKNCRGRVAKITGIRCDESLNRYCSVAQKQHNCWLSKSDHAAVVTCKPIYDWTESDVFKFLGERSIPYCPLYDSQLWDRTPFRVSTPIHTGSAKRIDAWRRMDPDFHQRVTAAFPEMLLQERYYGELAVGHENTFEALEEWIEANVAPAHMRKAVETLVQVRYQFGCGDLTDADWPLVWRKFTSGGWLKGAKDIQTGRAKKR